MKGSYSACFVQGGTIDVTHDEGSRDEVIHNIEFAKRHGCKSSSIYYLDGSIDVRITNPALDLVLGATFTPDE